MPGSLGSAQRRVQRGQDFYTDVGARAGELTRESCLGVSPSPGRGPWEFSPRQAEAVPGRCPGACGSKIGLCGVGVVGLWGWSPQRAGPCEGSEAQNRPGLPWNVLGLSPGSRALGLPASGAPSPRAAVLWVVAVEVWDLGRARLSRTVRPADTQRGRPLGPTPGLPSRRARARPSPGLAAASWPFPVPSGTCTSTEAPEGKQKWKSLLNAPPSGAALVSSLVGVGSQGAKLLRGTCWARQLQSSHIKAPGLRRPGAQRPPPLGQAAPQCHSTLGRVFSGGRLTKGHFSHQTTVPGGLETANNIKVFTSLFWSHESLVDAPVSAARPGSAKRLLGEFWTFRQAGGFPGDPSLQVTWSHRGWWGRPVTPTEGPGRGPRPAFGRSLLSRG